MVKHLKLLQTHKLGVSMKDGATEMTGNKKLIRIERGNSYVEKTYHEAGDSN